MRSIVKLSSVLLFASALLLSAAKSGSAQEPSPRATPQSRREATSEQKRSPAKTEQKSADSPSAGAFALAMPSRAANSDSSARAGRDTSEEQRHDRREEALEHDLVWLTAILAGVNVATTIIFLVTMFANIKAANATKEAADAARDNAKSALDQLRMLTRPRIEMSADALFDSVGTQTMTAYFTLRNAGERSAEIEEQVFVLFTHIAAHTYSPQIPFDFDETLLDRAPKPLPQIFESHDRRSSQVTHFKLSLKEFVGNGKSTWQFYLDRGYAACLAGYIRYRDKETKQMHETFFCRAWDRGALQFVIPPKMPDSYNHSS